MGEELRKKVVVLIGLIIFVVVLFIVTMVIIWSPKQSSETKIKLGTYSALQVKTYNFPKIYAKELENMFQGNEVDNLYNILNKDFAEEKGLNKDNFKQYLEKKKMINTTVKASNIDQGTINNFVYYRVKFTTGGNGEEYVIIRETSPKIYEIAFDDYVYENKKVNQNFSSSNVDIVVNSLNFGATSYKMNITITNNNDVPITINSDSLQEFVYGVHYTEKEIQSSAAYASGKQVELNSAESVTFPVAFKLPALSHGSMVGFIVKGVKIGDNDEIKDLKFSFI